MLVRFLITLGYCIVSSVVPVFNAEVYLVGVSAISPPHHAPAIIAGAALGQMIGKSLLYYAGRGAVHLPSERLRRAVAGVQAKYQQGGAAPALGAGVVLGSATVGLPPFFLVSVSSGIFRVPFAHFFLLGLLGMLIRFSVVVLVPQLLKG